MTDHIVVFEGDLHYRCQACGKTWLREPRWLDGCPGVTVYTWGAWPEHLLTKKQLGDAGFQTGKKLPAPAGAVYRAKSPNGIMWLYDRNQGVPKRQVSDQQRAALDKARYMAEVITQSCAVCGAPVHEGTRKQIESALPETCFECDKKHTASGWARERLAQRDFVVLDTETTSLHGEICEIAVIDPDGHTLLNSLVLPRRPWIMMHRGGAYGIHGISTQELARNAPSWRAVGLALARLVEGKTILTYNATFDRDKVNFENRRIGLPVLTEWDCIMEWFAQWYGDWSEYWKSFKWQPLQGGHRALGDCQTALARLREMAAWTAFEPAWDAALAAYRQRQALIKKYGTTDPAALKAVLGEYWEHKA